MRCQKLSQMLEEQLTKQNILIPVVLILASSNIELHKQSLPAKIRNRLLKYLACTLPHALKQSRGLFVPCLKIRCLWQPIPTF
jgi:hypothetical protein